MKAGTLFVLCIAASPALLLEHGMRSVNICGVSESPKTLQTEEAFITKLKEGQVEKGLLEDRTPKWNLIS